jgi:hypothetical protein
MDKVLKQSHDSHQALTSMQQNIHTTQLTTLDITWWLLVSAGPRGGVTVQCGLHA